MKNFRSFRIFAIVIGTASSLIACSLTKITATDASFASRLDESAQLRNGTANGKTVNGTDGENHIASVYLGSKSMPLKTTAVLPEIFYQVRRYQFPGQRFSVEKAAAIATGETGVLVRVADDVHGAQAMTPALIARSGGGGVRAPLPALASLSAGNGVSISNSSDGIILNADYTLAAVLNLICTQAGLNWEYRNGIVVIQRMVTRTLQLKVQAGTRMFDTSNAKSGSSQAKTESAGTGAITTGISSTATVTTSSGKVAAIDTVVELIRSVLSPAGKVMPNAATGSILVFDHLDGVERAEKIVNRENELLNRFTKIHIAIYTFEQNDSDERGIDWNIAFQNRGKLASIIQSPTTLTNDLGGSIKFSVLTGAPAGKFDGTSSFINFLNENGKTHTVFDQVIQARNRVATAASATVQKVYLAETTPAPASASGAQGGAVGLTPGTITTGLDLQMQPNIYDSGQMSLLFSLGLLDLLDIKTITSGSGANQSSIQGPETKGYNFQQDVPLRVGETTFITGYEATLNSYTRRALDRDAPLLAGGSFIGDSTRQKIFIFITPVSIGTTY